MKRIIVEVDGGVVSAVYSEIADVDVYVLDYDNLNAGDMDSAEVYDYLNKHKYQFAQVY